MKTHPFIAIIGLAFSIAACGGQDPTTSTDYGAAFAQQLDALTNEQSAHSAEISALGGVGLIGSVELGHATRMDEHLARMSQVTGAMMSCRDDRASPFDPATIAALTHDLRSECDDHAVLMMSAHDMDTARAEEGRHQYVVGKAIDKMRRQIDTMLRSSYTRCAPCPTCGM
jgi:hypothetical protein